MLKQLEEMLHADIYINKKAFEDAKNFLSEYIQFHEENSQKAILRRIFIRGLNYPVNASAKYALSKLLYFEDMLKNNILSAKLKGNMLIIKYEDGESKVNTYKSSYKDNGEFTNLERIKLIVQPCHCLGDIGLFLSAMCNMEIPKDYWTKHNTVDIEVSRPYGNSPC